MNLLDGINDTEDELYTFDSIIATEDKDNALEALNDLREYWLNHLPLSVKDGLKIVKVLEKEHRALEIVKKAFNSSSTYTYKLKDSLECGWITQEEYDLLKERLDL